MFLNFSPVRIAVILIYFTLCTACGHPKQPDVSNEAAVSGNTASDVNFIGGGTQAPDTTPAEEPYHSPTLSAPPPPTTLNWAPTIDQAIRQAERDNRKKVIAFFTNDSCFDCTTLERDVLGSPKVIAESEDWIFVKVDTVRNQDRADYYLRGADPPALVFLDKLGHEYRRHYGLVSVEEMVTMLRTWR